MSPQGFNREVVNRMARVGVILVRPKSPENIGAAARVATNMGVGRLIVVADTMPDMARVRTLATHHSHDHLGSIELFPDLATALAPFAHAVAATARQGRQRQSLKTPRQVLAELHPLLADNHLALIFGPEDHGLSNDDLACCQTLVTIPTAEYSSLNLAQAVAIMCYELASGLVEPATRSTTSLPRQANISELNGLYGHIEHVLTTIDFLKGDNYANWMGTIRRFIHRIGLRSREVSMLRGLCRQFLWNETRRKEAQKPSAPTDSIE